MKYLILYFYLLISAAAVYIHFKDKQLRSEQRLLNDEMKSYSEDLYNEINLLSIWIADECKKRNSLQGKGEYISQINNIVTEFSYSNYKKSDASYKKLSSLGFTKGVLSKRNAITWLELNTILTNVLAYLEQEHSELAGRSNQSTYSTIPIFSKRKFNTGENILDYIGLADQSQKFPENTFIKINDGKFIKTDSVPIVSYERPDSLILWYSNYDNHFVRHFNLHP